jgi:hypothetical protein
MRKKTGKGERGKMGDREKMGKGEEKEKEIREQIQKAT